jgi:hypothetical protein
MNVTVTALKQISGSYGRAKRGQEITIDSKLAEALEAKGLVSREPVRKSGAKSTGPAENKAVTPGENKAAAKDDEKPEKKSGSKSK